MSFLSSEAVLKGEAAVARSRARKSRGMPGAMKTLLFAAAVLLKATDIVTAATILVGPNPQPPSGTPGIQIYAFGAAAGDTAMARGDDNSVYVPFTGEGVNGTDLTLQFYGQTWGGLYINNNGNVSFGAAVATYTGQVFPTSIGTPMIAPFWADVDTRGTGSGQVWYRTVTDTATLTSLGRDARNLFLGTPAFTPTFAEIVTWDHVGYYNMQTDYLNSFQMVLLSDGIQTYTMFLYPKQGTQWQAGSASPAGSYAQVGFDSGDGTHYYNGVGTYTANMRDLWFLTNTVPANPGEQAFRIDGTPNASGTDGIAFTVYGATASTVSVTRTLAGTLQLGASGYVFTGAAKSLLQFDNLSLANTTDTVTFGGSLTILAHTAAAIWQGNVVLTGNAVLVAGATASLSGGTITLRNDSKVDIYATEGAGSALNYANDIAKMSGRGSSFVFDSTQGGGGGTLDLAGFSATVGKVSSVGANAGVITNTGTTASVLTFGVSGGTVFGGSIRDGTAAVSVVKNGTGTQILSGANAYTGTTTVVSGALQFANAGALYGGDTTKWTAGNIIVGNGATLSVNVGGSGEFTGAQFLSLANSGIFTPGSLIGIDASNAVGGVTFSVPITDTSAGSLGLTVLGTGTLTLSGANTYTGGTLLDSGKLVIGSAGALGTTGAITFLGGVLQYTAAATTDYSTRLTALPGGAIAIDTNGINVTLGSTISGAAVGLTKLGAGTLTLSAANTFTGAITLSGGTLALTNANALAGATLLYNASDAGMLSWTGLSSIAIGGLSGNKAFNLAGVALSVGGNGFDSLFSGALSGGSLTKTGSGILTLSGAVAPTSYAVNAGVLRLANPAAFYNGTTSAWTTSGFGVTSGATLALNVGGTGEFTSAQVATIAGLGAVSGGFAPGSYLGLDVSNAAGGLTYATSITDTPAGKLGLNVLGTGTLTLSGINTYTGGTILSGGVLNVGNAGALGTSGAIIFKGGTLQYSTNNTTDYSARITGVSGSNIAIDTNGRSVTFASVLAGTGVGLTKSGTGALTLTGNNTYSGTTTLSGGVLTVGSAGALAVPIVSGGITTFTPGLILFNGGTLQYSAANTTDYSSRFSSAAGQAFSIDTIGQNVTYAYNIASVGGSFAKIGGGTLTLSGSNSFSGVTTVYGGVLALNNALALGNSTLLNPNATNITFGSALTSVTFGGLDGTGSLSKSGVALTLGANTSTLTGNLTFGQFTKSGAGTFTLIGTGSFTGIALNDGVFGLGAATSLGTTGTITFGGGTLQYSAANATDYSARFSTTASQTYNIDTNGASVTFATVLASGGGKVNKYGAGTLTLNGANSALTGGVALYGGTLSAAAGGIGASGTITFAGGALQYAGTNTTDYSARFSNDAGQAYAIDTNGQSVTYATVLSSLGGSLNKLGAGTLTLSVTPVLSGGITVTAGTLTLSSAMPAATIALAGGMLNFNQAVATTYAGVLAGAGGIQKSGASILTLTGANTFSGGVLLSGGFVNLGSTGAIGTTGSISFAGGTLQYTATNTTDYSTRFSTATGQQYAIDTNSQNIVFATGLSSSGSSLKKTGTGTLTLSVASALSGGITLSAGTLTLSSTSAPTGAISVAGSATLILAPTLATTYAGAITSTGIVQKNALNTLTLTGTNSFTNFSLNAGTLSLGSSGALGSSGTITFGGGTLQYGASNTTDYSGRFSASAPAQNYRIDTNGQNVTFASALSSGGGILYKSGAGTLTLTGNNTGLSATTFAGGTISLGSSGALGSSGPLIFSGGTLQYTASNTTDYSARFALSGPQVFSIDTNGQNVTFASAISSSGGGLTKLGAGTLTITGATSLSGAITLSGGTLVLAQSVANTFTGVVSGSGLLVKSGTNTLTLSGANTFTSGVTLSGGKLALGSSGALGTSGTIVFSGGALQYTASNTTDYSSRFSTDVSQAYAIDTNGRNVAFATGLTSSGGSLVKSGAGTLTLSAANTYTGTTTVSAGTLQFATTASLYNGTTANWTATNLVVASGAVATFNVGGTGEFTAANLDTLRGAGFAAGSSLGFDTTNVAGGIFAYASSVGDTSAGALGLVKSGSGTLELSGTNTYTGGTTLNAGTLGIASDGALSTGTITINGGEIRAAASGRTLANAVVVNGSFNLGRATTFAGAVSLGADATITSTNPDAQGANFTSGFSGVISGAHALTFTEGANPIGAIVLSGANTYTGGTTISAGIIRTGNAAAFGTGNVRLQGGTLAIGDGTANTVTLGAAATLVTTTGTTLKFAALNTTTGAITMGATGKFTLANDTKIDIGGLGLGIGSYVLITGTGNGSTIGSWNQANDLIGGSSYFYALSLSGNNALLVVSAVPEPAAYGLLGAGALAFATLVRRRKRAA